MTIRALFDGSVLRPEEPVSLQPNYLLSVEEDGEPASPREEPSSYPLSILLDFATDLGVSDLAERHDHYARRR